MILYTDTSALVKRYVREAGSELVSALFENYTIIGTASLTQVEMASAMAKGVRQGWVDEQSMQLAWQFFLSHWPTYTRLPITTGVIERATGFAWRYGLRAYDSIQLACAITWQEAMAEKTTFACFDKRLQQAAQQEGLQVWPATG